MREQERLSRLKWIVLDVDGTLTDGRIIYGSDGMEMKQFHVRDGAGILLAQNAGLQLMILTARESECVRRRAEELHIAVLLQGIPDKKAELARQMLQRNLLKDEVAYMGDDLVDLSSMSLCGYCACPADAAEEVKANCEYIAPSRGGHGAVRDFLEFCLKARGQWAEAVRTTYDH